MLITKALIEISPGLGWSPARAPDAENRTRCEGAQGLAEDVRPYGKWMRDEAEGRTYFYPKAIPPDAVIAWLWARTVTCRTPLAG